MKTSIACEYAATVLGVLASCVAVLVFTGCSIASSAPLGPIQAPGVGLSFEGAVGYSPATITGTDQASGGPELSFSGSGATRGLPIPLLPTRFVGQYAPTTFADFSLDAGWLDAGARARLGDLASSAALPWGLALGARVGWPSVDWIERTHAYQVGLEGYPHLFVTGSGWQVHGVATFGLGYGNFLSENFSLPRAVARPSGVAHGDVWPSSQLIVSQETRLEAGIGGHLFKGKERATVVLQPHWVLGSTPIVREYCDCDLLTTRYAHQWGVILNLAWGLWSSL